ncbi:MAG: helix-turn-helix transcriptional regulator [Ruminococcaceae bacterium]|nr:helix-turn-helix transcriptional regulator [Oscillospiraceae bacterium]
MTEQIKEIGLRLATLRELCDMTPEEVAERVEVPTEKYIAYEKGERDFSFSFLYKCAEIFGVDVLDIMSGESPKLSTCAMVRKGQGFAVTRNKAYDYKHLAFTFKNKKAEPFLVTVEPTEELPPLNSHEGQEFNYIIEGKMLFKIGEITYELEEGDSVYFDSGVPHAEKALDGKKARFLAIVMK